MISPHVTEGWEAAVALRIDNKGKLLSLSIYVGTIVHKKWRETFWGIQKKENFYSIHACKVTRRKAII